LAQGAIATLAKISAVLPPHLRRELEALALLVGKGLQPPDDTINPGLLHEGIRLEHQLDMTYQTPGREISQRVVWPFALAYFDQSHVLMCWCELREDGTLVNLFSQNAQHPGVPASASQQLGADAADVA